MSDGDQDEVDPPDDGRLVAGRYRLGAQVGSGAMGLVWQAQDERLRRTVAVKQVLLPATADEPTRERAGARVMREARITARLHHPHVIPIYDVVEHEDQPFLIMEYLAAPSLATVLAQRGVLPADGVARIARQIADALSAAHAAGVVHRDVKPANVLLDDDGLVKVTDFGISRAVGDVTLTASGMIAGTPAYLAPELARGATAEFASDVYSLGSTLYAALEGTPPCGHHDNALALLHRVAAGDILAPRQAGPLTPLLGWLLAHDPAQRPSMTQVRDELDRMISASAGTEPGPLTPILPRPQHTAPPPIPATTSSPPQPDTGPEPARPDSPQRPPSPALPTPDSRVTTPHRLPSAPAPAPPQRRGVLIGALAVVLIAAGALVVVMTTGLGPIGGATAGPTTATASPNTSAPAAPTAPATDDPAATSPTADPIPPAQGTPEQVQQQEAVTSYYSLIPERLAEGWAQLTPSYQQNTAGGFASYTSFWSPVARVAVSNVSARPGNTVSATVNYTYRDGRSVAEQTIFTMVLRGGTWKIDNTTVGS